MSTRTNQPPRFDSVIAEAERAMRDVRRYITETFIGPTLQNLLDAVRVGEEELLAARRLLEQLRDAGLATAADFALFDKLRAASYRAQVEVYGVLVGLVNALVPGGAASLPQPQVMPAVSRSPRTNTSLRGLGDPVTITLGTSSFIALVLVALAALGIAYLLSEALLGVTHQWAAVAVARAQAEQFKALVTARLEVYRQCLAQGGDAATCSENAATAVPTPRESGTELTPPGNPDPTPWVAVGVLSTLGVLALGGMGYFWARGRMGMGRVPLRNVAALPGRVSDLDGTKSSYNLEIGGGLGGRRRKGKGKRGVRGLSGGAFYEVWVDGYPGTSERFQASSPRGAMDRYIAKMKYHHGEIVEVKARLLHQVGDGRGGPKAKVYSHTGRATSHGLAKAG